VGVTWITMAKVAGPLAREVERLVAGWSASALDRGDGPRVEDPAAVSSMLALADALERHAEAPPVVAFVRFVDPWTTAGALHFTSRLGVEAATALSDSIDVAFLGGPALSALRPRLRPDRLLLGIGGRSSTPEERWFGDNLRHVATAWEGLLESRGVETGLVLAFRPVGGCWTDEDVEAGGRSLPAWFGVGASPAAGTV